MMGYLSETLGIDLAEFRRGLIAWGQEHYQFFPWRGTKDPYRILVAEIMLHRTQRSQVIPIYKRFIRRHPSIQAFLGARKGSLQRILQPLGLRWRADLMNEMRKVLNSQHNGRIPSEKAELMDLPGVSDYVASALRCFSWDLPEPLLDTNTVRVVGRLFGLEIKDYSRRSNRFRSILAELIDSERPREFTYAMLDLADQVCTIRKPPLCDVCPLSQWCTFAKRRS